MIYSTSKCPYCKGLLNYQTNPEKTIANPFEKCPHCGQIYKNSYKEEWLTKSPFRRFLFLIDNTYTRLGIIVSIIFAVLITYLTNNNSYGLPITFIGYFILVIIGYHTTKKDCQTIINESLKRTEVKEYVKLLINSGYKIYPIDNVEYACRSELDDNINLTENINSDIKKINDNLEKAKKYFETAESLYKSGDIDEAIQLYNKSSDLGYDEADISLGFIYLKGKGIRKNKSKAIVFFNKAKLKGNSYASKILEEMKDKESKNDE